MKWNTKVLVLALCGLVNLAHASDGRSLMEQSEKATKSASEVALYQLELLDKDKQLVQTRQMEFYFKKLSGKESTLIRFASPAALQGTGLLIEDSGKAANDIWLYLPATRKLRRIAGAEKTNWFMGTEFTNEDFEDYQLNLYRFDLEKETACGTGTCFVVTATAENAAEKEASGYSKKVYFIDKQSLYPVAIDYYSREGSIGKRLTAEGLKRQGSYWRPEVVLMKNLQNGKSTRLTSQSRELDGALDDFKVSSRFLRAD